MYARSTTVRGNPQSLDDAIAYLRDEVMPAVQEMDGCIGLSMLCDRDSARCIATTAWETEEAMHNSESGLHAMRQRYAEMLGGPAEVQEWEIAVLHRTQPSPEAACCRVIWTRGDPANLESTVDAFRMSLLPRMEELPGFCSVSMMIDRGMNRATMSVTYRDREALMRSRSPGADMREEFAAPMGARITEVAEFDLVIAHLRVPEMA